MLVRVICESKSFKKHIGDDDDGEKKFDINLEKNGSLVDNIRESALAEKLFFLFIEHKVAVK